VPTAFFVGSGLEMLHTRVRASDSARCLTVVKQMAFQTSELMQVRAADWFPECMSAVLRWRCMCSKPLPAIMLDSAIGIAPDTEASMQISLIHLHLTELTQSISLPDLSAVEQAKCLTSVMVQLLAAYGARHRS
jgi:hypothetical protein